MEYVEQEIVFQSIQVQILHDYVQQELCQDQFKVEILGSGLVKDLIAVQLRVVAHQLGIAETELYEHELDTLTKNNVIKDLVTVPQELVHLPVLSILQHVQLSILILLL